MGGRMISIPTDVFLCLQSENGSATQLYEIKLIRIDWTTEYTEYTEKSASDQVPCVRCIPWLKDYSA